MRKVELSLKEKQKYEIIKKLVETNGNKERARIKLGLKSIRQINRLIVGYNEFGKEFFVHGNHGLYWSVDKSELHEVTDSADLYTLRGNKKEHRLCIFYQSTFEGERDSPCYVLAIYQRLNGIYLESGEELFQERLCLDEFNLVTEGEKKKKWNQDKIRAFRRKLYRGKFVPDNDELVNEVEIREDTVWFSNDYGECIALSLGKNGEVVFYGGGNRFILQMGK